MRRAPSLIGSMIGSLFGLAFLPCCSRPSLARRSLSSWRGAARLARSRPSVRRSARSPRSGRGGCWWMCATLPPIPRKKKLSRSAWNAADHDQLRVGDPVKLRYMPNATLRKIGNIASARLGVQQRPMGSFVALLGDRLGSLLLAIGIWLVFLFIWAKSHIGVLVPLLAISMIGGGILIGSGWPGPAPTGEMLPQQRDRARDQAHRPRLGRPPNLGRGCRAAICGGGA